MNINFNEAELYQIIEAHLKTKHKIDIKDNSIYITQKLGGNKDQTIEVSSYMYIEQASKLNIEIYLENEDEGK